MKIKKETILLILVAVFILSYSTIVLEIYPIANSAIKIAVLAVFLMFPKVKKMMGSAKLVILFYLILMLYALLISPLSPSFSDSILLIIKYSIRLLIVVSLIMILQTGKYSEKIAKLPAWIGTILAVQSIILFILIFYNIAPAPNYLENPTRGSVRSYGILGYANALQAPPGGHEVLRVASYFSEPLMFAELLEYSIFVLFGYYWITRKKKYFLMFSICATALLLTFSLTGYIAVFVAIPLFLIFNQSTKCKTVGVITLLLSVAIIYSAHLYLKNNYEPSPQNRTVIQHLLLSRYGNVEKNPNIAYGGRVHSNTEAFKLFLDYPIGIGLMENQKLDILSRTGGGAFDSIHLAGAHLQWLVKTGFVGIFLFICIFIIMYKQIRIISRDNTKIQYYVALAFISLSIHHLASGSWIEPLFLFTMALILSNKQLNCQDSVDDFRKLQ